MAVVCRILRLGVRADALEANDFGDRGHLSAQGFSQCICQPSARKEAVLSELIDAVEGSSCQWKSIADTRCDLVTIFDWDDTLFCTTHVTRYPGASRKDRLLRSLAKSSRRLLEAAMARGRTFIVTNAAKGWVEYSAQKYMPEIWPVLAKVKIISARSSFELMYPEDQMQWKVQAFISIMQQLDTDLVGQVISIGDSWFEMEAASYLRQRLEGLMVKTVKLQEYPSGDELKQQQSLLLKEMRKIIAHPEDAQFCYGL
mmetsp:Transcript_54224/g.115743  ORF Transcript_54224/g.115743 Transcript_54224/m.115743 type:complete len:257 (+) Transcript_54224:45-815(+)